MRCHGFLKYRDNINGQDAMTTIDFNFKYLFLNRRKVSQDMKHEKHETVVAKFKCWLLAGVGSLLRMERQGQEEMSPIQGVERGRDRRQWTNKILWWLQLLINIYVLIERHRF